MTKTLSVLTLLIMMLSPVAVYAHSSLHGASPGPGAAIDIAPTTLDLHFSATVSLINISITSEDGKAVPLATSRIMKPQQMFTVPLPALESGSYTVEWNIMGGDSHKMSGSYVFTIL